MFSLKPLLEAKRKQRISYAELYRQTGIDSARIYRILNPTKHGAETHVRLSQLTLLCNALGVNEAELIVKEGEWHE